MWNKLVAHKKMNDDVKSKERKTYTTNNITESSKRNSTIRSHAIQKRQTASNDFIRKTITTLIRTTTTTPRCLLIHRLIFEINSKLFKLCFCRLIRVVWVLVLRISGIFHLVLGLSACLHTAKWFLINQRYFHAFFTSFCFISALIQGPLSRDDSLVHMMSSCNSVYERNNVLLWHQMIIALWWWIKIDTEQRIKTEERTRRKIHLLFLLELELMSNLLILFRL